MPERWWPLVEIRISKKAEFKPPPCMLSTAARKKAPFFKSEVLNTTYETLGFLDSFFELFECGLKLLMGGFTHPLDSMRPPLWYAYISWDRGSAFPGQLTHLPPRVRSGRPFRSGPTSFCTFQPYDTHANLRSIHIFILKFKGSCFLAREWSIQFRLSC